MRLLFDENLSPRLGKLLEDVYPGSESVLRIGLSGRPDPEVWRYAVERGMMVVGKDSDFIERAMLSSLGGKFVWLRMGNCSTETAHLVLRAAWDRLQAFEASENVVIELP